MRLALAQALAASLPVRNCSGRNPKPRPVGEVAAAAKVEVQQVLGCTLLCLRAAGHGWWVDWQRWLTW